MRLVTRVTKEDVFRKIEVFGSYDAGVCREVIRKMRYQYDIPYEKMHPKNIRNITNLVKKAYAKNIERKGLYIES